MIKETRTLEMISLNQHRFVAYGASFLLALVALKDVSDTVVVTANSTHPLAVLLLCTAVVLLFVLTADLSQEGSVRRSMKLDVALVCAIPVLFAVAFFVFATWVLMPQSWSYPRSNNWYGCVIGMFVLIELYLLHRSIVIGAWAESGPQHT